MELMGAGQFHALFPLLKLAVTNNAHLWLSLQLPLLISADWKLRHLLLSQSDLLRSPTAPSQQVYQCLQFWDYLEALVRLLLLLGELISIKPPIGKMKRWRWRWRVLILYSISELWEKVKEIEKPVPLLEDRSSLLLTVR
jgi:hypothetical protein